MTLEGCNIIHFKKIEDPRGNLTPIEGPRDVPFAIQHVSYLYDVPGGSNRGGHAHKQLHQVVIAISGSFDVLVKDGKTSMRYHLNQPYYGLHIPPLAWRELDNFSSNSVCLVLGSAFYDEKDYYRSYDEYIKALQGKE